MYYSNYCRSDGIGSHARLKIVCRKTWEFDSPLRHLQLKTLSKNKKLQAYVIGLSIGDGNLSNPNGRAVRLRITCDKNYPLLLKEVMHSIQKLLPQNKVSIIKRKGCFDVSCYSNQWEKILEWKAKGGSKIKQNVRIPDWIKKEKAYIKECLRGLFQTDGSIYKDRKYTMVNFVTEIPILAKDVVKMIQAIGYKPNLQKIKSKNQTKFTIRLSRDSKKFINDINLWKK